MTQLTDEELERYGRHIALPEISVEGQQKLKSASVLVVGAGGLGSSVLCYLAAAGVGRIGVVDFDAVDASNLQRQVIHSSSNVGTPKVFSAKERMGEINPHIQVETHKTNLQAGNARQIIKPYDVVLDGTDNFSSRYLLNDACKFDDKPYVHGSVCEFEGQCSVFWASRGPCYRCLYPEPPEKPPGTQGILGVVPGVIGCIQAAETIKLIIGIGEPLIGRLLYFDALKMKFREVKLKKNPNCALCGKRATITTL